MKINWGEYDLIRKEKSENEYNQLQETVNSLNNSINDFRNDVNQRFTDYDGRIEGIERRPQTVVDTVEESTTQAPDVTENQVEEVVNTDGEVEVITEDENVEDLGINE